MLAAVVAAVTLVGTALTPAGAGEDDASMILVRKTVQGPATGGFTVVVNCVDNGGQATLNFDASGAPTIFSGGGDWSIVGGAWKVNFPTPDDPLQCTATETDADGAPTTTWTCDYENVVVNGLTEFGCDAPSGTGTGPVGFSLGSIGQGIETQLTTVHFTNTIPAPAAAVPAAPTFTG